MIIEIKSGDSFAYCQNLNSIEMDKISGKYQDKIARFTKPAVVIRKYLDDYASVLKIASDTFGAYICTDLEKSFKANSDLLRKYRCCEVALFP